MDNKISLPHYFLHQNGDGLYTKNETDTIVSILDSFGVEYKATKFDLRNMKGGGPQWHITFGRLRLPPHTTNYYF